MCINCVRKAEEAMRSEVWLCGERGRWNTFGVVDRDVNYSKMVSSCSLEVTREFEGEQEGLRLGLA